MLEKSWETDPINEKIWINGAKVTAEQLLGKIGGRGRLSKNEKYRDDGFKPHLHFATYPLQQRTAPIAPNYVYGNSVYTTIKARQGKKQLVITDEKITKTVLEDGSIINRRSESLEHGDLTDVNGIVLHHTASSTSASTLHAYKTQSTGAHFLVDENGKIYQTADTGKVAWHVGKIRSKCQIESACSADDLEIIRAMGFAPTALHNHEKVKPYPNRYPTNTDSIGIEIVGALKNESYGAGNSAQVASVKSLIGALQQKYKLSDADVYRHGVISYKHPTEGQGYGY